MADDIRLATAAELSELVAEVEGKADSAELESSGYLKRRIAGTLSLVPVIYDFEDGQARFTVPRIGSTAKGLSKVLEDENGNKYQSVCSTGAEGASTTIGSNSLVYSELDLSAVIGTATNFSIEFEFKMNTNGRMRVSIGDLDVLRELTGDTKYQTTGIAADMYSSNNYTFQVNGAGAAHESFFGKWLHCKFEINVAAQSVKYTVENSSDATDIQVGTTGLRGTCSNITGIALYTWLADDTVCFDNIKILIASEEDIDDRTIYVVEKEGVHCFYIYINDSPVLIGRSDLSVVLSDLATRIQELEAREGGWE